MTVVKLSDREGKNRPDPVLSPEMKRRRARMLISLPVLLVLVFIVVSFNTDYIPSSSMEPTLVPGDHIVTMRAWIAYPFGKMPERGDIITFRLSTANQERDALYSDSDGGLGAANESGQGGGTDVSLKPEILIKRVIGLPGDRVQIIGNAVYINGQKLLENYATMPADPNQEADFYPYAVSEPLTVPPNHLFVLGDNRTNSDDGRFWGTLKRSDVTGKFVTKLFHQKLKHKNVAGDESGGQ